MEKRTLGTSGLEVSALGMGCMGMGGMFNVAPDKVQKLKITTVCLDHGKTEPNPRVPFKPVPIESCAKDSKR